MAHEYTDPNELKAEFAAKWHALKSEADREAVRKFLAELVGSDEEFELKLPPQNASNYDPNTHGPRSHEELEQMLVDGLNSGAPEDATTGIWQKKRAEFFKKRGIELP